MTILDKIKDMNADRGWSIYELSKRADVSQGTLYSCIRRQSSPSNAVLDRICKAYGITLFQFYHDMDSNGELTDEQKADLKMMSLLDENEKEIIRNTAYAFISKNSKK